MINKGGEKNEKEEQISGYGAWMRCCGGSWLRYDKHGYGKRGGNECG
jgi:hypothetical protein